MTKDGEIHVVGVGEMTAIRRAPDLEVEVAEGSSEGLDAVARFAVAEAAEELESDEGIGVCWADGGIGEEAMLNEADVVAAAGLWYKKLAITIYKVVVLLVCARRESEHVDLRCMLHISTTR